MIESVSIKNFQVYENYYLELDEHVTTIVGRNGVGKSTILRFLRWFCTNQPRNNNYLRHGCTWMGGKVEVDGRVIKRKKSPEKNTYSLESKIFSAVSNNVPDEVAGILNVGEVNFQAQLDAPYWFLLSPGEVSKSLNGIINLTLIDRTLGNLASGVRKAKLLVTLTEEKHRKAEVTASRLRWTVEADKALRAIQARQEELDRTHGSLTALKGLVGLLGTLEGQSASLHSCLAQAKHLLLLARKMRSTLEEIESLKALYDAAGHHEPATVPTEDWDILCSLAKHYFERVGNIEVLSRLVTSLREAEEEACRVSRSVSESEENLRVQTGNRCPLCGKTIR